MDILQLMQGTFALDEVIYELEDVIQILGHDTHAGQLASLCSSQFDMNNNYINDGNQQNN